jgi:hypothetical protein
VQNITDNTPPSELNYRDSGSFSVREERYRGQYLVPDGVWGNLQPAMNALSEVDMSVLVPDWRKMGCY